MRSSSHSGHSADVKMRLRIGGMSLPVAQLGPDFLLLKRPLDHPANDATLVLCVDGNERQWNVRLPAGISAESRRVAIEASSRHAFVGDTSGVGIG
jgi:hypothetical protein